MKNWIYITAFLCFYQLACAQDTTRILFVGNSFTYFNNMPQMVKALADSAGLPVVTGMHAPGGISVGDVAQGTQAHMNNPALFSLIRSRKWDFAVIQDNQGRFVRDSAVFPSTSLVIQGHLNIMDSVKANNSCAKIILFGGWAWKNGMPPFGNTGTESIQRILVNYRVLNDTMKETIAPIGLAWIKAYNYLPAVNLWDPDDAHPSYAGSFLTASVLFSTIFNLPARDLDFVGTLTPSVAFNLKAYGDSTVFTPVNHSRYNLGGIRNITIQSGNGQLSLPGSYLGYNWYKNNAWISNAAVLTVTANGTYRAEVVENDNCIVKTCNYTELSTGFVYNRQQEGIQIYPNPAAAGELLEVNGAQLKKLSLYTMTGRLVPVVVEERAGRTFISTKGLTPGYYLLVLEGENSVLHKKISICD